MTYPKRLIEVDLPIARISAHARREKSIRHGHISTLHIWWARRPLAACRAVICAALWPDPGDPLCPVAFREAAIRVLTAFARRVNPERITDEKRQLQEGVSEPSRGMWEALASGTMTLDAHEPVDGPILRNCLLHFIADFANWDNSTVPAYLETARRLTGVAHASLSDPGYRLPEGGFPQGSPVAPRQVARSRDDAVQPSRPDRMRDAFHTLSPPVAERQGYLEADASAFGSPLNDWLSSLDAQLSTLPRPLVVDPFCGGGSIPLEALRVGADAFASDLNPVPVLLNKVVLEYIPKYGKRLAEEVRRRGDWIQESAFNELQKYYPTAADGSLPLAYAWARTVISESPDGEEHPIEVPLLTTMWLAKASSNDRALRWVRSSDGQIQTEIVTIKYADGKDRTVRRPLLQVFSPQQIGDVGNGTLSRGSVTCPVTGFTTPVARVRLQLKQRAGGCADARLLAVREMPSDGGTRTYREPNNQDVVALRDVVSTLEELRKHHNHSLPLVPDEPTPKGGGRGAGRAFSQRNYGMDRFCDMFTPRQQLSLVTICKLIGKASADLVHEDDGLAIAVQTCLGIALARLTDFCSSLCTIKSAGNRGVNHMFGRQAIPIVWDFAETNPINTVGASWVNMIEYLEKAIMSHICITQRGEAECANAARHPLADDMVAAFVTDPPYYDAIPYSDLSDYFYVWLKRSLPESPWFSDELTPKCDECIVDDVKGKDAQYFESTMQDAMAEGRRMLMPNGIGVIVFAHKSTDGWESMLQAMISAGWIITGSWPIDTEQPSRLRARSSAALASSVHLVCRPREDASGAVTEAVGEWRDVLGELPKRIHEWMPRLAAEGVVGADAIFACLGPALEIFSRYRRVEKANGDPATLREYLEFVWAAVSTEALSLIFKDADAAGLEPDARLTAMWLWTLGGGKQESGGRGQESESGEEEETADDEDAPAKAGKLAGFTLEYDAARKIAQGLGIHLEQCQSLVEVKGDKARLLPVSERTETLFGKGSQSASPSPGRKKKAVQKNLFETFTEAEAAESGWSDLKGPSPGQTLLDRVHQTMILFAAGRGELMKRFLVEDGIGQDPRFWKLAQSLSALYPRECEEKRWVDGVLARKKGLGL